MESIKYLYYIAGGFIDMWVLWYLTGGPLSENRNKPFMSPSGSGFEYNTKVDIKLDKLKEYIP